MMGFYDAIKEELGQRYIRCSCIPDESTEQMFIEFLTKKPIRHALEIGTWFGVSSLVMSYYADRVSTIDIRHRPEPGLVWSIFGGPTKLNIIHSLECSTDEQKRVAIEVLDFDFAFVDGGHRYNDVKLDFELVKRCGRVLFHDYYEHTDTIPGLDFQVDIKKGKDPTTFEEVKRFVDELPPDEVTIKKPFALWEKR